MFVKNETRGMTEKTQHELMIFTLEERGNECSPGAISHMPGSKSVNIQSNVPSYGSIPVNGHDNLKLLRDALINICEAEGIK